MLWDVKSNGSQDIFGVSNPRCLKVFKRSQTSGVLKFSREQWAVLTMIMLTMLTLFDTVDAIVTIASSN